MTQKDRIREKESRRERQTDRQTDRDRVTETEIRPRKKLRKIGLRTEKIRQTDIQAEIER